MCLSNAAPDEEKPAKRRFYDWTCCMDIEESDYAKHDKMGCEIQDMEWAKHD